MLKIRLARIGKRKKPTYRFVISEAARDTYGRALEILGHYNPFTKVVEIKKDRILYWISKGAQMSPTVHNLLVDQNVITEDKVKASKKGKKKKSEAEGKAKPETAKDVQKEELKTGVPAEVSVKVKETKEESKTEESKKEEALAEEKPKEKEEDKK